MIFDSETQYRYTLKYNLLDHDGEEDCIINKNEFWPYGEVREGAKLRGQWGFMKIEKVFDDPHMIYGKFIAKSIKWEEMNENL